MRHDWFTPEQFAILEDCGFEKEYGGYKDELGLEDYNKWRVEHVYEDGSRIEAICNNTKDGSRESYALEFRGLRPVPDSYQNFNSFSDLIKFIKE